MQLKKFEQIDALRFFAVLPVLISHWELFDISKSTQFLFASNGVNLFFAISGFLITLGLIKAGEKEQSVQASLWKFYVRRFLRIFPIYYLMLLLLWFFNHPKVAGGIWWYLSYSTNFYCIRIQGWGGLPHLWSLAVEEQFYLVWPFVILLTPRRFIPAIIGLIIIMSLSFKTYWLQRSNSFWVLYMNPIAVLDVLGLGALLSYYYHFQSDKLKALLNNKIFTLVVLLQLIVVLYLRYNEHCTSIYQVINRFSFGLFSVWLIGRAVFGFKGIIGYILTMPSLKYIGKISYGVYLLHILIPGMLMGLKYPTDHFSRFCMYFILTIAICSISWYSYESRILKLKDKFE
jgi:peptidoglycan/LPS O-acetylase OafA/YrhL